ncbi:hypothetical protein [Qipengyuania qiaonensis]|uniref:DUF3784 domain-containing protein n=1 Tax=Qipengyuania qiaonensis TaxID=2867240 RepID=A0ABS7J4G2_9SPHN|nr:hypothetical protein [Qipengyuania qiaonensis]MBX7482216.1 hypothetical protein [Qipengyuania qiaonensis]
MLLGVLFVLGIVNFAVHKAVLESDHPLLDTLPRPFTANGGRLSLAVEFLVLLASMMLSAHGWPAAAWGYALYSALNAITGWLLLDDRV